MAMRRLTGLVALPLSLLLVATPTQSLDEVGIQTQPWPLNLAAHEKYWPHDGAHAEAHRKRQVAVDPASPIAVKKMGTDEGEKFFLDYWQFGTAGATAGNESAPAPQPDAQDMEEPVPAAPATGPLLRPRLDERTVARGGNASATTPYNPPLRIHTELTSVNPHFKRDLSSWSALFAGRARRSGSGGLAKRGFQCPTGSSDCSGIGRPNTCCDQGETCNIIPDTGLGDVGCCPPGQTCSGNLDNCDLGFTKCSDDLGGGCCIPMYVCLSIGCGPGPGLASLLVTTLTATTTKLSNPPSAAPSTTISSSSPPPITTTTTSTATCTTGFQTCPSSLGGGCCRTDRVCGATDCPLPPSSPPSLSSNAPAPPIRATSAPDTTTTTTTSSSSSSTITATGCPTGFYQCSAVFNGGCCRTGRDCDMTSCPATASISIVTSNGITIVVPVGGGSTSSAPPSTSSLSSAETLVTAPPSPSSSSAGVCATGWSSCPASLAGGCCPSGFSCAISNCQAVQSSTGASFTASATAVVGKEVPGAAASVRRPGASGAWTAWLVVLVGVVVGALLVL